MPRHPTLKDRPPELPSGPMRLAPENEQGVVFLFAHLARRYRMRVDRIRQGFPDCIAYEKVSGRDREVRIEFEFLASSFKAHGHDPRGCDCIVCWEDDWPDRPAHLRVIELRQAFGLGFKVWFQPADEPQFDLLEDNLVGWRACKSAHKGDLVLIYRCSPDRCIKELFEIDSALEHSPSKAGYRHASVATFRNVCRLPAPLFHTDLEDHRELRTAGFVRQRSKSNQDVTAHWPKLYRMILMRNPKLAASLRRFDPECLPGF